LTAAIRSLFSGPRLEALLEVGSYPCPAADGRLWKYLVLLRLAVLQDRPGERLPDE